MPSRSFWSRLRQARLVRVLLLYFAASWLVLQVTALFIQSLALPAWFLPAAIVLLLIGLVILTATAWVQAHPSTAALGLRDDVPGSWEVDLGDVRESVARGRLPHLTWGRAILGGVVAFTSLALVGLAWTLLREDRRGRSEPAVTENAEAAIAGSAGPSSPRATMTIVPFTESPGLEAFPAWSPDGRSVAHVSERSGNRDIWIKPVGGGADVQVTSDPAEETQPAWSPDGRRILFVSSRGQGSKLDQNEIFGYTLGGGIWSVPAYGGMAVRILEEGFDPAWSPDGRRVAFDASRGGPRRIWIANADGSEPIRVSRDETDAAVHTRPQWAPDGRWISYRRQEGSRSDIQLVPVEGGTPRWVTRDGWIDMAPAWHPRGDGIVFSSDRGGRLNLWRVGLESRSGRPAEEPVQVTAGAGDDIDPAWSPDGGSLAYATVRVVENIWRMPLPSGPGAAGDRPQAVLTSSRNDNQPAVSPDGERLAFSSDRGGTTDLWVVAAGGGTPDRLTDDAAHDMQPVWSPDATRLAFFSDRSGNNDIWMVSAAGGAAVRLTDDPADDINPYWSPDGSRIAFMSDRSGRSEVWVANADGSELRRLTDIGATGHDARWSPDGKWIAFTSLAGGDRNIWAVPSAGGDARRITPEPTQEAHALWSADGRSMLYLTDHRSLRSVAFPDGDPRVLFEVEPGQRIDDTNLSADGRWLYFTLLRAEGDLWLARDAARSGR